MMILPVDQGFEHGPLKSFSGNPEAFDPLYLLKLAIDGKFNAFAAPVGFLEQGLEGFFTSTKMTKDYQSFIGQIPLILKLNSSNSLAPKESKNDQAITASVKDALRLGCSAVGLTIYPGSNNFNNMLEEAREIIKEAKSFGLACVVWSYARGEELEKEQETALDVICYSAHIAALIGADIIKVKPPSEIFKDKKLQDSYKDVNFGKLSNRISLVKQSCFNGKKIVIFSGGEKKNDLDILREIQEIKLGFGDGSIIGRNMFQRSYEDALTLCQQIREIYQ
jgi:class I fructose-bisphosphate aldolase